jgi:hypothetical protein
MTIVIFTLTERSGGTHLVITETGFDALPPERREPALTGNTRGWGVQAERIAAFVAKAA